MNSLAAGEGLTDGDWAELGKRWRVAKCSECGGRFLSSKDVPEPGTCGMLKCLQVAEKERWV